MKRTSTTTRADSTNKAERNLLKFLAECNQAQETPMLNDRIWDVDASGATVVYAWTPQLDITAYELALCMTILSTRIDSGPKGHEVEKLPRDAKRHFAKV